MTDALVACIYCKKVTIPSRCVLCARQVCRACGLNQRRDQIFRRSVINCCRACAPTIGQWTRYWTSSYLALEAELATVQERLAEAQKENEEMRAALECHPDSEWAKAMISKLGLKDD